jgi:hypothetical protein
VRKQRWCEHGEEGSASVILSDSKRLTEQERSEQARDADADADAEPQRECEFPC